MKNVLLFIFFIGISMCAYTQQKEAEKYNQFDEEGRRQGIWYSYFRDGGLRYEGKFIDDRPVGTFYYYFPQGGLRAEIIHDHEGREEEDMVRAVFYHRNGTVSSEGFYIDEKRHGLWRFFNERGQVVTENYYHHGENHGVWKVYYSHGKVAKEKTWHYGERDGNWIRYYENGQIHFKSVFKNDKLNGRYEVYGINGRKRVEGFYQDDLQHRKWTFYTPRGEKQKVVHYNKGEVVEEIIYIETDDDFEPIRPGDEPFTDEELRFFYGY